MNKIEKIWGNHSPATVLSLGFMILGIGCISWAIFGIWAQSDYSGDAIRSSYSIPATFAAGLNQSTGDSTALAETDTSFVLPVLGEPLYSVYPAEGDNIGSMTIPALELVLPIIEGTGVNELKKGVGHFIQSVLPGEEDNCVLSGHRETVFRHMGDLVIGDLLIVQTSAGIFKNEGSGTRIVHEDDKTVIVPTDHAVLTMTTCYPFNTPGYFPDRYIVTADLVISK